MTHFAKILMTHELVFNLRVQAYNQDIENCACVETFLSKFSDVGGQLSELART